MEESFLDELVQIFRLDVASYILESVLASRMGMSIEEWLWACASVPAVLSRMGILEVDG